MKAARANYADRSRPSGTRHAQPAPNQGRLTSRRTSNLYVCQLLGNTKLKSTVCHLGIEADDALVMSEQTGAKSIRRSSLLFLRHS
jgi:hypothetical protein